MQLCKGCTKQYLEEKLIDEGTHIVWPDDLSCEEMLLGVEFCPHCGEKTQEVYQYIIFKDRLSDEVAVIE